MPDFGPNGGDGGHPFDEVAPPGFEIAGLFIRGDPKRFLVSIQALYRHQQTGDLTLGDRHGGPGETIPIALRGGEYFTEISGRTGQFVDSLALETNQGGRFGRFGGLGGSTDYENPPTHTGLEIFGFFGRSGTLIDAIGIHTRQR
jgi:hypothetical protein